jgi:hypothetical protein
VRTREDHDILTRPSGLTGIEENIRARPRTFASAHRCLPERAPLTPHRSLPHTRPVASRRTRRDALRARTHFIPSQRTVAT